MNEIAIRVYSHWQRGTLGILLSPTPFLTANVRIWFILCMLVLILLLKVAALWSSRTGGVIPAHRGTVRLLIFPVCVCLPDFPFPPCLTVCGPVISPWWSAMVTSFLIHLVTVWQSVWLAVFSSMFSSLWFCLFVTIYGHDTNIYITSISCLCHWQSAWCCYLPYTIYGSVPCYLPVIASDTDRPD